MCMCMYSLCVCRQHVCTYTSMCVCHCFVPMPFLVHVNPHLFSKRQSGKPSNMWSPQMVSSARTRMMCHCWLCRYIPVSVLTWSNYHTNSLMRKLWVLLGHLISYLKICFTQPHLFISFLIQFPRPSPPFISPIFASYTPPLLPPTSPPSLRIPWWVGGKFNGDMGSQKGRGFASYQNTVCVQTRGFLSAHLISLLAWLQLNSKPLLLYSVSSGGDCLLVFWCGKKCVPDSHYTVQ